jgi:hypothetical protein
LVNVGLEWDIACVAKLRSGRWNLQGRVYERKIATEGEIVAAAEAMGAYGVVLLLDGHYFDA